MYKRGSVRFVPRDEWEPRAIAEEKQRQRAARVACEELAKQREDQKKERAWLRKQWRKLLKRKTL